MTREVRCADNSEDVVLSLTEQIRYDSIYLFHRYETRKAYVIASISAEASRLDNQARFIDEKIGELIHVEDQCRDDLVETLQRRGYDPDPTLVLKKQRLQQLVLRDRQDEPQHDVEDIGELCHQ